VNCAERKDLILLHVFEQLEPEETAPLLEHLSAGCPRCAGELAAARTVAGHLALAVPPLAPSSSVKERLLERIGSSTTVPLHGGQRVSRPAVTRRWPAALAAAALAAGIAAVAILIPARRQLDTLRIALANAESTLRSFGSSTTRVAALEATEPQPGASGRLFWDESKGTWHVFVSNMKPSRDGRTYELWFITVDQRKIPAGTFVVGPGGHASFNVALPKDLGDVALAAVTEEPAGGVPQPTGAIQLVGKLGT
jgi:anti-sigma-K factor RskA